MRRASSSSRRCCRPGARNPSAMASMRPVELSLYVDQFARFDSTESVVFAALEIDLLVKSSDELFNEFWRHQALAQTVDDQPFKSSPTDALAIGTGAAAPSGRAGEVISPDCGVTAATLLAAYKPCPCRKPHTSGQDGSNRVSHRKPNPAGE